MSQQYYQLDSIPLNRLEQLIYSEDRETTWGQHHSNIGKNEGQMQFYKTLFSQMDLEMSFHTNIHQKYKQYHQYLINFEFYTSRNVSGGVERFINNREYSIVYLKDSLIKLQCIMVELGATDDELSQLNLFSDTSINNIRALYAAFAKMTKISLRDSDSVLLPINGEVRFAQEQKLKFFDLLIKGMSFYYNHTKPESDSTDGFNTFSYLSLNQFINVELTTALPQEVSNPFSLLLQEQKKAKENCPVEYTPSSTTSSFTLLISSSNTNLVDAKYSKYTTTTWLNSYLKPAMLPFILHLININVIDYKHLSFFPSLGIFLDALLKKGFDTNKCQLVLEMLVFLYEFSATITSSLSNLPTTTNRRQHKYYTVESYTCSASHNIELLTYLSYEQLIQFQQKIDPKLGFFSSPKMLQLLISKFLPANFTSLRNNQDVGVISPYKSTPLTLSSSINNQSLSNNQVFYPTRHIIDTPVMIMQEDDLEVKKNLIPSFLLTTMDLYAQIFNIIKSIIKVAESTTAITGYSTVSSPPLNILKSFYCTALTSFLQYTADHNIWRFDLFNDELLHHRIYWSSSIFLERKDTSSSGNIAFNAVLETLIRPSGNGLDGIVFPQVTFESIISLYLSQYFSLPFITSHQQCQCYNDNISEAYLKRLWFTVKNSMSHTIFDISCDQSTIYSQNSIKINSLETIQQELAQVQSRSHNINNNNVENTNDNMITMGDELDSSTVITSPTITSYKYEPIITTFDLKTFYPDEMKKIDSIINNRLSIGPDRVYLNYGRENNRSMMTWSDEFRKLKNNNNIDENGNIRLGITATGINNLIINIYHIDIFSYYQSQLNKGENVMLEGGIGVDFDPNIDLEGLIPHYTTRLDLHPYIQSSHIQPYQSFKMNLCLDNIPKRGIFMIEVLNGLDGMRACVRKGQYSAIQKKINAGTLLLLLDENGQIVKNPRVFMGNEVFKPNNSDDDDDNGYKSSALEVNDELCQSLGNNHDNDNNNADLMNDNNKTTNTMIKPTINQITSNFIFIPSYDTTKTIILTDSTNSFASCIELEAIYVDFSLSCDWFTSVESLTTNITPTNDSIESNTVKINNSKPISLRTGPSSVIGGGNMGAEVLLKPLLQKSGKVIDLSSVNIIRSSLRITAELEFGVVITDNIEKFSLIPAIIDDNGSSINEGENDENIDNIPSQEIIHTFTVPNNLSQLSFELTCIVEFQGKEYNLSSSHVTTIAQINKVPLSSGMIFLRRCNGIYIAHTIDKTGQPIPFTKLYFNFISNYHNSNHLISNNYVYSDNNGCVELGSLFGVNSFTLTTDNNRYSFIRGSLSYDLTPYHITSWPSSMAVIVNDSDAGITPLKYHLNQQKNQQQNSSQNQPQLTPQVSLPLPTGALSNINLATILFSQFSSSSPSSSTTTDKKESSISNLFKSVFSEKKENNNETTVQRNENELDLTLCNHNFDSISINSTNQLDFYPFQSSNFTSAQQQSKLLQFIEMYGCLSLVERSQFTPVRRHNTAHIVITPTSIEIYGLRPNRNYTLRFNFNGVAFNTNINTYRNPEVKQCSVKNGNTSFGLVLPPHLYFDTTLNRILDYLICRGRIIPVKDFAQQLIMSGVEYNGENETLHLQLSNFNQQTTKLLIFASNLITTPSSLINLYQKEYRTQMDNTIEMVENDIIRTGSGENSDYVRGAQISGERDYVNYRRELIKSSHPVGIMLPQPTMLLNKRLRQYTEPIIEKQKDLAKGGVVDKSAKKDYDERMCLEECEKDDSYGGREVTSSKRMAFFSNETKHRQVLSGKTKSRGGDYDDEGINFTMMEFNEINNIFDIFKYKSSLLLGITPSSTGKITIQRNGFNKYSTLTIIAYESKSMKSYGFNAMSIDIPQHTIRTPPMTKPTSTSTITSTRPSFVVDNSFTLTLQPHKQYTEEHCTGIIKASKPLPLFTNNSSTTTSITSTNIENTLQSSTIIGPNNTVELEVISSRQDLFALLQSLVQTSNQVLLPSRTNPCPSTHTISTALQKFHFLPEWGNMNDSEKLTMLDRHSCHELNLFIFFQDRVFFESILRFHLANKFSKDVVDLWLLSQEIALINNSSSMGKSNNNNNNNNNNRDWMEAIKDQSRIDLTTLSSQLNDYNIFEQILIQSICDPDGLRSLAKQIKLSGDMNVSLNRDNLVWVNIFESCLRRTMLKLNTALPDSNLDDDHSGESDGDMGDGNDSDDDSDSDNHSSDDNDDNDDDDDDSSASSSPSLSDHDGDEGPFDNENEGGPARGGKKMWGLKTKSKVRSRGGPCVDFEDELMMDSPSTGEMCRKSSSVFRSASKSIGMGVSSIPLPRSAIAPQAPPPKPLMMMQQQQHHQQQPQLQQQQQQQQQTPSGFLGGLTASIACNSIMPMNRPIDRGPSMDEIALSYEKKLKPSSIPSYKPLEKTGEYEERTWYIDSRNDGNSHYQFQNKDIIEWSMFWVDFALYLTDKTQFSIDNNFSSTTTSNKAFASSSVIDLVNAGPNEYLLCIALMQLSPVIIPKQSLLGTIKGHEIIQQVKQNEHNNNTSSKNLQWNTISSYTNSTQSITSSLIDTIAPNAIFRYIKQTNPQYPIIILHKQVQQLNSTPSTNDNSSTSKMSDKVSITTPQGNNNHTNLNASHYYIDIFETIQKRRQVYVEPTSLFKRRAYMCKTVISNTSPETIKTKVLVTIPDGSTSLAFTPSYSNQTHSTNNQTHLNYLQSRTIYCEIPSYSSYVIQYSFLLGNRDHYIHYGATITSTNSAVSQLYCFVPSVKLITNDYKALTNRRDAITIAREASNEELLSYLAQYYHVDGDDDESVNNQVNSQKEDESDQFKLDYILWRFNDETISLQDRWKLYMNVYSIARGYLSTKKKDSGSYGVSKEVLNFISYLYYFFQQNANAFLTPLINPKAANTTHKQFTITPDDRINIVNGFSILFRYKLMTISSFKWKSWQHLEYLPLVAARIHSTSMGTDIKTGSNQQTQQSNSDKDIFIPDKQLKEQYIKTLEYCLVHSSTVSNIPPTQLLSLIYYAVILNQNVRVVVLLQHLLNSVGKQYEHGNDDINNKTKNKIFPISCHIQLAYLLIYIDVLTYGQLQTTLTLNQLNTIAKIYNNNDKIINLSSSKQKKYGIAVVLSTMYEKYPIKQWKILFSQSLQYLKDGHVIVSENNNNTTMSDDNNSITTLTTNTTGQDETSSKITPQDYDVNVPGMSSLQRDLRVDSSSSSTPSLSIISTQYTSNTTDITVSYCNLEPNETCINFDIHYIDSELLLSHKPFISSLSLSGNNITTTTNSNNRSSSDNKNGNNKNNNDQFTQPHLSITIPLPPHTIGQPGLHRLTVPLPSHLSKEAQLTLRAPLTHLTATTPLLHSGLTVQVLNKQGIVIVLDSMTLLPISGVYIKSYINNNNNKGDADNKDSVRGRLLCDKYTDIRGKASFIDASNNKTNNNGNTPQQQQFALIISHPNYGTTVTYTNGPNM